MKLADGKGFNPFTDAHLFRFGRFVGFDFGAVHVLCGGEWVYTHERSNIAAADAASPHGAPRFE